MGVCFVYVFQCKKFSYTLINLHHIWTIHSKSLTFKVIKTFDEFHGFKEQNSCRKAIGTEKYTYNLSYNIYNVYIVMYCMISMYVQ